MIVTRDREAGNIIENFATKKAASSRENGKKDGRPCNHCAGDGGASDYDRKRYCPGDECASCGCTLGDDWYWYIDRDQAPGYPDFS